jgi:hypothetical protein
MTDTAPPEDLRVSDVERAAGQERLRRAVADGQLDLAEFDERCAKVWAARTRADLSAVTRDLPEPPAPAPPAAPAPRSRVFADTGGGTAMRVLATIWACAFVVNVLVWLLASVAGGELLYVWPVWLTPPAAALGVLYATGIGRPRR